MITIDGAPELSVDGDYGDATRTVAMVVRCIQNERPIYPGDLYDEPAKFVAALEYLRPFATRELEEYRKRCQAQT